MSSVFELVGAAGTFITLLVGVVMKLRSDVEKRLDKAYDRIENLQEALEDMTFRALAAEALLKRYDDEQETQTQDL